MKLFTSYLYSDEDKKKRSKNEFCIIKLVQNGISKTFLSVTILKMSAVTCLETYCQKWCSKGRRKGQTRWYQ